MRKLLLTLLLGFGLLQAQDTISYAAIRALEGFRFSGADSYGDFYFYNPDTLTLVKTDANFHEMGRQMLTLQYSIIQKNNPLFVVLFSETAQEILILDNVLNQKNTLSLKDLGGYYTAVYTRDANEIWLMDRMQSKITVLNRGFQMKTKHYILPFVPDFIQSMIAENGIVYILSDTKLTAYDTRTQKLTETALYTLGIQKMEKSGDTIYLLSETAVYTLENGLPKESVRFSQSGFIDLSENTLFRENNKEILIQNLR